MLISWLPTKLLVFGFEFAYPNLDSTPMPKFHVDDHNCFQEYATEFCPEFGGNLSVCSPPNSRPLIIFGQDESIFSQFSFNSMQWVGLSIMRSILSKNDGIRVMVSTPVKRIRMRDGHYRGADGPMEEMIKLSSVRPSVCKEFLPRNPT